MRHDRIENTKLKVHLGEDAETSTRGPSRTGVACATQMKISREAGKPPDFRHRPPAIARDRVLFLHLRYIAGELLYLMNIITSRRKFLMKGGVVVAGSAFARADLFGGFTRGRFDARAWRIEARAACLWRSHPADRRE